MREIKFRAWGKTEKKMFSWEVIKEEDDPFFHENKDYEPMQYTGLTDKNGKEVYEGDIIKCIAVDGQTISRGIVSFSGCDYIVNFKEWSVRGFYYLHHIRLETLEVIGNIYENANLSEVTE